METLLFKQSLSCLAVLLLVLCQAYGCGAGHQRAQAAPSAEAGPVASGATVSDKVAQDSSGEGNLQGSYEVALDSQREHGCSQSSESISNAGTLTLFIEGQKASLHMEVIHSSVFGPPEMGTGQYYQHPEQKQVFTWEGPVKHGDGAWIIELGASASSCVFVQGGGAATCYGNFEDMILTCAWSVKEIEVGGGSEAPGGPGSAKLTPETVLVCSSDHELPATLGTWPPELPLSPVKGLHLEVDEYYSVLNSHIRLFRDAGGEAQD